MSFTPELLYEALSNLYVNVNISQEARSQSEAYVIDVKNLPEGILIFLQVIQSSEPNLVRKSAITNLLTIVNKQWSKIPPPIQDQSREMILGIIQNPLTHEELSMMADACADIFEYMGFWNEIIKLICVAYQSQDHQFTMLFLSKIFPVMPDQIVIQMRQAFQNMAFLGLQSDDLETTINAIKIYVLISKKAKDISIAEPAIECLIPELIKSPQYSVTSQALFSRLWQFVRDILSIEKVNETIITEFFNVANQILANDSIHIENRRLILSEFEPVISMMPSEMLIGMLSFSFLLALAYVSTEEDLPEDYFTLLDKSLLKRTNEVFQFSKAKCIEFITKNQNEGLDIPSLIVALCIIRSMLENAPDNMVNEINLINTSLHLSFTANNELVLCASLRIIEIIDEPFSESGLSDISIPLMQQVMPLLTSPSEKIRIHASNALLALCDMCDAEVEGLFNHLWSYKTQNLIPKDTLDNYLLILSKVLFLSKDIPDDVQNEVLKFVEEIFQMQSDDYIIEKAVSLNVLTSLFNKNSSLLPILLPTIVPLLNTLLTSDLSDCVKQSLNFLTMLAKSYRSEVLGFISNYFVIITAIITNSSVQMVRLTAMNTAASIVKFCCDSTLIPAMTDEIMKLFKMSDKITIIEVCHYIAMMSKGLSAVKSDVIQPIFEALIEIVKTKDDNELLNSSFEALSKLYKRCRVIGPDYFDAKVQQTIQLILAGQIKYFKGNPEGLFELQSEMSSYLIDFVDVYLRQGPPDASTIYPILFKWMTTADEEVMALIIGAITESLKRTEIDLQFLSSVIQFLMSIATEITAVRLRHNVVYFLNTFLNKFKEQVNIVAQFLPAVDKWWIEGSEKTIGYQACLSNLAVLYLRLLTCGVPIPIQTVANAISVFPPVDKTETENMAVLILNVFSSFNENQELINGIIFSACVAFADLLTRPPTNISVVKLAPETLAQIQQLFRNILAGNDAVKTRLMEIYQKNSEKMQIISQYF